MIYIISNSLDIGVSSLSNAYILPQILVYVLHTLSNDSNRKDLIANKLVTETKTKAWKLIYDIC